MRAEPEPRQQADDERERPVGLARPRDRTLDIPAPAACSASAPTAASATPGSSFTDAPRPRREQPERRPRKAARLTASAVPTAPNSSAAGPIRPPMARPAADRRRDQRHGQDSQDDESAHPRPQCAALLEPGNVPDLLERPAERERDAQTGPQRPCQPDRRARSCSRSAVRPRPGVEHRRPGCGRAPSRGCRPGVTGCPGGRTRVPTRRPAAAGTARRTRSRR